MAEKYAVLIKYKYLEYIESAKLSDADAWAFLKGIIEYDKTGIAPIYSNPVLSGLFAVVKIDLDKNKESYEAVSQERSKAGKEGAKKRWGGRKNSKDSKSHDDIANIANDSSCYDSQKNMAKMHDLDLDSEFDSDSALNSSGFAESQADGSPSSKKAERKKKAPLRERDPVNDMERVEKAYLQNWDDLYGQGKIKTADPIVNWNQTRFLLKKHFEKLKPDQIIHAIKNGMTDDFILDGGYSLGTMLSAIVLNRLINSGRRAGTGSPAHRIAADNIPSGDLDQYFS
jgi:hypothetical protein